MESRRLTRQRRRDTLCVLVLALITSFMIGFLPGASVAWVASGIFAAVLVAYVSLLVHLRRLAEERERKLHYLRPKMGSGAEGHGAVDAPDGDIDMAGAFAAR